MASRDVRVTTGWDQAQWTGVRDCAYLKAGPSHGDSLQGEAALKGGVTWIQNLPEV